MRRTTSGGATTREARLEHGGEVLAADARSMTARVEELLGLDVDQFNRTVVLPQGRFADFLHDNPPTARRPCASCSASRCTSAWAPPPERGRRSCAARRRCCRTTSTPTPTVLTDDQRAALVTRIDAIGTAREVVTLAQTQLDELVDLGGQRRGRSLAEVAARGCAHRRPARPDGVDELDATVAAATEARNGCRRAAQLGARGTSRAADRRRVGPDVTTIKLHLQLVPMP